MSTNYFAEQGRDYTTARPAYPAELFSFLASECARRVLAWDCATGTGQAATLLSRHFEHVVATDISAEQIRNAVAMPNVTYNVGVAESYPFAPRSVDLIVAAQAAPWLDLPAFFEHCRTVAAPGCLLALFGFREVLVDESVDPVLRSYFELVGPHWPQASRLLNDSRYGCIEAPFEELQAPMFEIKLRWSMKQVLSLLDSYSGARAYLKVYGELPSTRVESELSAAWGAQNASKEITIPMSFRLWQVV